MLWLTPGAGGPLGLAFPPCAQTVEAAYILAQEHLLEGLSLLKEECRVTARQQEIQIHSDMDQILQCRRQLEEKVGGQVVALMPEDGGASDTTRSSSLTSAGSSSCSHGDGAHGEAVFPVCSALPGLGSGGADGADQFWFPGGPGADRDPDGPGVPERPEGGHRGSEEGQNPVCSSWESKVNRKPRSRSYCWPPSAPHHQSVVFMEE